MEKFSKVALARELIEAHPHAANRALARRLQREYPQVFATVEAARSIVRTAAGQNGDEKRKKNNPKTFKPAGKAGWKPELPPSMAEPWLPVQIEGPCRVACLSDIHVPYHTEAALHAAVNYIKKRFNPTVLELNGDYMDFYSISRYLKSPLKRNFGREVEMGEAGLEWLSEKFPKARKIFKEGNHDERWDHWCWQNAEAVLGLEGMRLRDILHLSDYGFEHVGDQRPVMAGKLAIFHGHELGKGITSPVNPARGAFMRTLSSVLVGHHHRTSSHAESDMWHSETVTWSTGCLCDLRPEYNRVSNKWNWGFAIVDVAADNTFQVHNFRLSSDYEVRAS